MGPIVDSRIKTLGAGIPMLQTEFEVMATKHDSLAE